ncbi:hypothetical protein [Phenylobacterium sp.]|uniref:hypothetical protein n=1 Tax=Phenylobacterium sp. TaxID=1871053 RepID=UPI002E2FCCB8|nr:hypothetical protein [Phenylobacterium sp.]HEX3365106.1 hypothetical protein [Phenylobacterium sp.]
MDETVNGRILPRIEAQLDELATAKSDMTLDGVRVFDGHDRFLPGKIAVGMAYALLATPRTDPRFAAYLADFRSLADLTVDQPNDTWGIYYYVEALWMLKKAGLLDQAVSAETLAKLRIKLDWRTFVRPDLTLIDLPNNYYGVAFSVARLRNLLGWEDGQASERLLAKMLDHYGRYSGRFGFADETDGEGRFDRYSVLLIGEIAQRFIETDTPPPPELKVWLRRSVDLMLPRFNMRGEGFEYGRSIGAYGETCFLEVMTAAAKYGVLTPREETMAYAFSSRITARYADFWYDPQMGSVNLWRHGRRTDDYRGLNRILGENLSLGRQYIYTDAIWNDLGFKGKAPDPAYAGWLRALPKRTVTWFAKGEYDRLLITLRDGDWVIGLPLINGGAGEHMTNPYFPAPFSPGLLSGVADSQAPNLVPRLTLADGSALMPLAFFKHVQVSGRGAITRVSWLQTELDRMGQKAPVADGRLSVKTSYSFSPGRITRTDEFRPTAGPVELKAVDLEFGSYSGGAVIEGGAARFASGGVTSFKVDGLDGCASEPFASPEDGHTPVGPLASRIVCKSGARRLTGPLVVRWTMTYR